MKSIFFFAFVTFSLAATAQDLYYLQPTSVSVENFPAPPVAGSLEDLVDFEDVTIWQTNRSEGDCFRAAAAADGFATSFFGPPFGPLTKKEAEALVDFQERLFKEVNYFARQIKDLWQRPRTFERSAVIQPCIPLHPSYSYPSGHAATAYVAARAFAMVYPERTEKLTRRGTQIGWDRVLGGVHYPSDVRSGRDLGDKVFEALLKEDRFVRDIEQMKGQ